MPDKKIILFGAGFIGRRALKYLGQDKVYCFVDNNKASRIFCDKPVISFRELLAVKDDYTIVLSAGSAALPDIEKQCEEAGVRYALFGNIESYEGYESSPEIRKLKDIYKGERCFLIGNGPSLRAEDLTKLNERREICFACNAISRIFDKTPWRPKYFATVDRPFIKFETAMLASTQAEYKFISRLSDKFPEDMTETQRVLEQGKGKLLYMNTIFDGKKGRMPRFSPDPSKAMYECGSVMFVMVQLAIYMGFVEVYLIGVDGNAVSMINLNNYLSENRHFYQNDEQFVKQTNEYTPPMASEQLATDLFNAYTKAESYTREHGARIYNATRGGNLEVFERVDFDSLF